MLVVSPSLVTAAPKTSPLLHTSQALCTHELFLVLRSRLIQVKNEIWPSSSGTCFSARHSFGLVSTHSKTSKTPDIPERTGIDTNPYLGARLT